MIDFSTDNLNIDVYYRLKNFIDYKILSNMVFILAATHFTVILPSYLPIKNGCLLWAHFYWSILPLI